MIIPITILQEEAKKPDASSLTKAAAALEKAYQLLGDAQTDIMVDASMFGSEWSELEHRIEKAKCHVETVMETAFKMWDKE